MPPPRELTAAVVPKRARIGEIALGGGEDSPSSAVGEGGRLLDPASQSETSLIFDLRARRLLQGTTRRSEYPRRHRCHEPCTNALGPPPPPSPPPEDHE